MMISYPKIKSVKPLTGKKLEIIFDSGNRKIYDCSSLLQEEPFIPLRDNMLFKNVHVDSNGYGIVWNDDIDLSESELWINGKDIKKNTTRLKKKTNKRLIKPNLKQNKIYNNSAASDHFK